MHIISNYLIFEPAQLRPPTPAMAWLSLRKPLRLIKNNIPE